MSTQAPWTNDLSLDVIKGHLKDERARVLAQFQHDSHIGSLTQGLLRSTDRAVQALWRRSGLRTHCSLIAVGGYGRRELLPHSDVDLLILLDDAPSEPTHPAIEHFISACWDVGLEIGHSVRTLTQCAQHAQSDVTIQTSLLEARWLAGSRTLYRRLVAQGHPLPDPQAFFHAKLLELQQRHIKFQETPYSLEPNVKESPGGLRDLQSIRWMACAAGLGRTWMELAQYGALRASEARVLARDARTLMRIRAWLHILARRREDRLVFDLQHVVAQSMGLPGTDARQASEQLMQRYYRTAKSVMQLSTLAIQNLQRMLFPRPSDPPAPLDTEFQQRDSLLETRDPDLFEHDPGAILRAFHVVQQHRELDGMSAQTLRAIWHARTRINRHFRRDPRNIATFLSILQAPEGLLRALRQMNEWSVLGRYLPAFRRIVGRMQHDLFHVYTVDQHILMVVRNLRRFQMAEHAHEYPFCSQLMASFERPWLLFVAALFHDIAKGRGGDHSQLGRRDAARFCRSHGITGEDQSLIEFLVLDHLTMSQIAQKRDLSDPATIASFVARVGTERRLTALYLLTVADIRGTSPKVWNAWKGKLLEDLYRATQQALGGQTASAHQRFDAHRRDAIRVLNFHGIQPSKYAEFWQQLDIGYFLRTEPEDIAWQTRMLCKDLATQLPVVCTRLAPIGEGFQVVVYLPDQPDLFARICGYFDRKSLSVLDAKIHTTRHGHALDSFLVIDPHPQHAYRDMLTLVEVELAQRLRTQAPLPAPARARPSRRSRSFPIVPHISLHPDEAGRHYLLSMVASDRTGLLYSIAHTLAQHGVNLQAARIMTLGERAEDVFLIDGPALQDERKQLQLEHDLLTAIEGL